MTSTSLDNYMHILSALESGGPALQNHIPFPGIEDEVTEEQTRDLMRLLESPQHVPVLAYVDVVRELGELRAKNLQMQGELQALKHGTSVEGFPLSVPNNLLEAAHLLPQPRPGRLPYLEHQALCNLIKQNARFSSVSYAKTVCGRVAEC